MKVFLYTTAAFLVVTSLSCKSKKEAASTSATSATTTQAPDLKPAATATVPVNAVVGLHLGNLAPEIEMANPKGELVKLSSLKGKLVLIDFWASWCGPCRRENPSVVAAYNKYHTSQFKNAKGFEIFSVSLDSDKNAWMKAIEKDQLVWPYHVSDLLFWNNAAARKYEIQGIPYNFLLNGEGIIIAKNLRGPDLEKAIEANL